MSINVEAIRFHRWPSQKFPKETRSKGIFSSPKGQVFFAGTRRNNGLGNVCLNGGAFLAFVDKLIPTFVFSMLLSKY